MAAERQDVARGLNMAVIAELLREPLATSRALLELLQGVEAPDPGIIGGYLGPALAELQRACELLDDVDVIDDAGLALGSDDEQGVVDARTLLDDATLGSCRRGRPLPSPLLATAVDPGTHFTFGNPDALLRLVRAAIELAVDMRSDEYSDEQMPMSLHEEEDDEHVWLVLDIGRPGDVPHIEKRRGYRFKRLLIESIVAAHDGTVVFAPEGEDAPAIRVCLPSVDVEEDEADGPQEMAA